MLDELIVPSKTPGTPPRDSIRDEAFNIGKNGENYRIRDVANMVAKVVPNCEVAFAIQRIHRRRSADCKGIPRTTLLSAEDRAGPSRSWCARFDDALGQLSRRSISSLSRNDNCTMVSVGFA
jgi:hypothetical protein